MASIAKFDQWQSTAGVTYNTILNVVQVVKTNTVAGSPGAQWADVPGMAATDRRSRRTKVPTWQDTSWSGVDFYVGCPLRDAL